MCQWSLDGGRTTESLVAHAESKHGSPARRRNIEIFRSKRTARACASGGRCLAFAVQALRCFPPSRAFSSVSFRFADCYNVVHPHAKRTHSASARNALRWRLLSELPFLLIATCSWWTYQPFSEACSPKPLLPSFRAMTVPASVNIVYLEFAATFKIQ